MGFHTHEPIAPQQSSSLSGSYASFSCPNILRSHDKYGLHNCGNWSLHCYWSVYSFCMFPQCYLRFDSLSPIVPRLKTCYWSAYLLCMFLQCYLPFDSLSAMVLWLNFCCNHHFHLASKLDSMLRGFDSHCLIILGGLSLPLVSFHLVQSCVNAKRGVTIACVVLGMLLLPPF